MKGGAWGEDILKWATMIFAFLFGIGVAILGIWTIFNVFRAGWDAAGPQTWGALMGGNGNANANSGRTRQRRNRNGNRNNGNPNTGLGGAPVPEPAPPNNGMEGFKLR
jgi:hypothetical protein